VPLVQTGGEDISIFIINHGHENVDGEGGQHDPHRDHHVVEPQLGEPALQPVVNNSQLAPAPPESNSLHTSKVADIYPIPIGICLLSQRNNFYGSKHRTILRKI
jgi:hypothetical protein